MKSDKAIAEKPF